MSVSFAQPFVDVFNTKFQYFPSGKFQNEPKNNISSTHWSTSVLVPIEKKNKDVVIIGMTYSVLNFKVKDDPTYSSSLRSTAVQFGYKKQWKNEKWKTLFMLISKVNSNLTNVTSRDYQVGGAVIFNYKKKDNLRLHFGAYYNREYFGNFIIPLLGIEWKVNENLNLFGDLPNSLNLEKKLGKMFYAGIIFQSTTSSYRPGNTIYTNDFVREGQKGIGHNQIKLHVNYYITNHFVVYAEVGHTYKRNFQLFRDKTEINLPYSAYRKTTDTFLVSGGLAYRFRLDTKK